MIRLFAVPDENRVALSVRDYGCGMTPDVMQQIFEPYFTTKAGPDASGKGGTGLGLSACKEVIEQHQGRIRVDSSIGKGTMFTILLPVYQTSEIPQLVDHSQTDATSLLSESPLASS